MQETNTYKDVTNQLIYFQPTCVQVNIFIVRRKYIHARIIINGFYKYQNILNLKQKILFQKLFQIKNIN